MRSLFCHQDKVQSLVLSHRPVSESWPDPCEASLSSYHLNRCECSHSGGGIVSTLLSTCLVLLFLTHLVFLVMVLNSYASRLALLYPQKLALLLVASTATKLTSQL